MTDLDAFARDCEKASKQLRRLPADLRKALGAEVQTEVAKPLAAKIAAAAGGPWGPVLSASVKTRKQADPTIVVGGSRRVLSGGGSARSVVFGTEWGTKGQRLTTVNADRKSSGRITGPRAGRARGRNGRLVYRRRSTAQFLANQHPFIFPTIGKNGGWVLDRFADIVDKVLGGVSDGR